MLMLSKITYTNIEFVAVFWGLLVILSLKFEAFLNRFQKKIVLYTLFLVLVLLFLLVVRKVENEKQSLILWNQYKAVHHCKQKEFNQIPTGGFLWGPSIVTVYTCDQGNEFQAEGTPDVGIFDNNARGTK